jgi:type II secretory pathway predicted ATPase ExeA
MRFYGLARPPVDAGFFQTEHHAQVSRDIRAAIVGGRLIALTAVIGSGKTVLSRRLRAELEREGRVIVSRSLSIDNAKISLPLLEAALFYDLTQRRPSSYRASRNGESATCKSFSGAPRSRWRCSSMTQHDLHPKS